MLGINKNEIAQKCKICLFRLNRQKGVCLNPNKRPKKMLVEILSYCLMNNHFHLLIRQKSEKGITKFMRKIGTGYTNYFNKKYKRSGSLFQGKFKSVLIKENKHLLYIPIYIHLNPLDFKFYEWRENKIKNYKKAIEFLENYRWSSYPDYIGKNNFPEIIKKDFLISRMGNEKKQKESIYNWIKSFDKKLIDKVSLD